MIVLALKRRMPVGTCSIGLRKHPVSLPDRFHGDQRVVYSRVLNTVSWRFSPLDLRLHALEHLHVISRLTACSGEAALAGRRSTGTAGARFGPDNADAGVFLCQTVGTTLGTHGLLSFFPRAKQVFFMTAGFAYKFVNGHVLTSPV